MATLTLHDLNLKYADGTHAVKDVGFGVPDGEFWVFLGPSGCGKTSTLRMVAGLEAVTSGEIRLDERVINDLYPGERDIAMVFQHYALYPHLTVRDHFEFPLKARKMSKEERKRRVDDIAALLRMTDLLDAKPRQLSGGQAQRTAIGRALIRQPKLFLLDEPLTSLDATLRMETRAALKRLQKDLGITTVYVTHDQEEALSLADQIVVMHEGRVQQIADSRQLYQRPVNLFVAGFIGTPPMNVAPATLAHEHGATVARRHGWTLELPRSIAAGRAESTDAAIVVGIRPEDVLLTGPDGAATRARVTVVEPQGDEVIVSLDLEGSTTWKARAPRLGGPTPKPGDVVGLAAPPERLHLFDATTEARLA